MKPFEYIVPTTLHEAIDALQGDAAPIAGGQSLLLEMKQRQRTPSRLVSLASLPAFAGLSTAEDGELVVGAGTSYAALHAAELPGWHRLVAEVAGDLADRPVRNLGTIGGALCQGDPRYDMPAIAVGLDARLDLASAQGRRTVTAAELHRPEGGLDLRPNEILTAVRFPPLGRYAAATFTKVRHRTFDAAVASATCALSLDGEERISAARVTLGAVTPAPVLLTEAAAALVGAWLDDAPVDAAAAAATTQIDSLLAADTRQQRYQRELVAVVVRRAITQARDQERS